MNTIIPRFFSFLLEEIPVEVARLASELHCQRTQNLTIEVLTPIYFSPQKIDELFYIEANELIFTSIAARNQCTAVHSFRKLGDFDSTVDVRKLFDEAQLLGRYEIGETDYASGRLLGLMTQKMNVLHAAIETIANSDAPNVFNLLRNIGNALPFLGDVNLQELVDLAAAQHSRISRDLAAGMFFKQVSDYLSARPPLAKELYALVRENMADANTNLYGAALMGMAMAGQALEATELALHDAGSDCIDLSATALWVLGHMTQLWENEQDAKSRVQETLKAMAHHSDSNISRQALLALSTAAASQPELIAELLSHAQLSNQTAVQVLGDFVYMNLAIVKDQPNLTEILCALTDLNIEHTNNFDYALSQLIKNGTHDQQVYDCLTTWMLKHPVNRIENESLISCFNQSLMELVNKSLLPELITRWIVSDERVLGAAFSDLISHLWSNGVKQPVFSKDIIDTLDNEDFKYLARRLLGWTFFEEPLLSLTFSLLETKDAQQRSFNWVRMLLVNDVGRNYPHATLEAIREKLSNATPEMASLLQATQAELLTYADTIKQLPVRHELHPPIPMRIRHAVALKKAKEQREARDKNDEQSMFRQIFKSIHQKAGTGSFSICDGRISEVYRLASHSFFVTLPAQSVIDPLNDEITRMRFRLAKRGDE